MHIQYTRSAAETQRRKETINKKLKIKPKSGDDDDVVVDIYRKRPKIKLNSDDSMSFDLNLSL